MVDDSGELPSDDTEYDVIHTEIKTDVQYEEQGKTLAVQTVKQSKRRLDWRVGFKDGSFAEAHDLYFNKKLLNRPDELRSISEWPNGKLNDKNEFFPVEEMKVDSGGEIQREYGDGQDGVQMGIQIINSENPEIILEEWWEDMKERYDNSSL